MTTLPWKDEEESEVQMNEDKNSGGITFWGLLQIVFITLKLCKVVDWPWLWVLAPIWIGVVIVVSIAVVFIISALVIHIKDKRSS